MNPTTTHDTTPPPSSGGLALLWDIDGPLNPADAKPHQRPAGYQTHRLRPAGYERDNPAGKRIKPLRVWINPEHGPKILALGAELHAENWWATTWRLEANRLISPLLGLPPWPTLFTDRSFDSLRSAAWKWDGVLDQLGSRPLIWFDDDFDQTWLDNDGDRVVNREGRERFLAARGSAPTLLHHVDPRIGLRDEDFEAARIWAASLSTEGTR